MKTVCEKIAKAICQSDRYETGEGTCAVICMDQLGSPRKNGCHHIMRVHGAVAEKVFAAIKDDLK